MMYKKIVLSAFAKAQTETPASTKTQWADYIADCLWEESKHQVSRRTLLNYYNYYKNEYPEGCLSPKAQTIEALCKYLCYPSYSAFVIHHSAITTAQAYNTQTATYVVDVDNHRDVVTILIQREHAAARRKDALQIA